MHKIKGCFILSLIFMMLLIILFAGYKYRTTYAKTEIMTETSEDNQYTLKIYMIGEPEWPFGATHCRMELFKDSKRIIKHPIDIYDDGAIVHEDNFDIKWHEDNVTVTVSGSEQDDNRYILSFDGTIE